MCPLSPTLIELSYVSTQPNTGFLPFSFMRTMAENDGGQHPSRVFCVPLTGAPETGSSFATVPRGGSHSNIVVSAPSIPAMGRVGSR
jgi:hypothetical protein